MKRELAYEAHRERKRERGISDGRRRENSLEQRQTERTQVIKKVFSPMLCQAADAQ